MTIEIPDNTITDAAEKEVTRAILREMPYAVRESASAAVRTYLSSDAFAVRLAEIAAEVCDGVARERMVRVARALVRKPREADLFGGE